MTNSQTPDIEPLSRMQILIAMAVTAVVLFSVAKLGMYLGEIQLRPLKFTILDVGM